MNIMLRILYGYLTSSACQSEIWRSPPLDIDQVSTTQIIKLLLISAHPPSEPFSYRGSRATIANVKKHARPGMITWYTYPFCLD
jgi:hypothetical protein